MKRNSSPFKWRHYAPDVILLCVRWYCRYQLSYRDVEEIGKMNFYLSAMDDLLKHPNDQPSIGIILCKTKNNVIVEYALRDTNKPMGVSTYQLTESLPKQLIGSLPTIEELEAEVSYPGTQQANLEDDS